MHNISKLQSFKCNDLHFSQEISNKIEQTFYIFCHSFNHVTKSLREFYKIVTYISINLETKKINYRKINGSKNIENFLKTRKFSLKLKNIIFILYNSHLKYRKFPQYQEDKIIDWLFKIFLNNRKIQKNFSSSINEFFRRKVNSSRRTEANCCSEDSIFNFFFENMNFLVKTTK